MIASMTGYGRGDVRTNGTETLVEIRSVNNRFLDISVRLPRMLSYFEDEVKNIIKQVLLRGRINVIVNVKESANENESLDKIDVELAQTYLRQLKALKKSLKIGGKIRLEHMLALSDIFIPPENDAASKAMWEDIKKALMQALENLKQMRLEEGKELSQDLIRRVQNLDVLVHNIESLSIARIERERDKLRERIQALGIAKEIDESRLELEISILASRMDVTEECIRFKSHDKLFLDFLENNSEEAVGRKLNFLLQEMTREANTIGSKAYDADISHLIVECKEEVEKLREQVQNIE